MKHPSARARMPLYFHSHTPPKPTPTFTASNVFYDLSQAIICDWPGHLKTFRLNTHTRRLCPKWISLHMEPLRRSGQYVHQKFVIWIIVWYPKAMLVWNLNISQLFDLVELFCYWQEMSDFEKHQISIRFDTYHRFLLTFENFNRSVGAWYLVFRHYIQNSEMW